ncbi:hypothetical protein [Alicyclobacillus sp. SO9]|uniref:hypothetical protein n=1 Tax=Alicyclobacillus sp. SO9 TaxID=2665646 RepID=UPI0018E7FDA2|nr:hypothetical protein [Alicyclobacillus sp. SO9]QQE78970.1 hypothetical protein GI364_00095 [Alicyclobacillus sp. SO9]
MHILWNTVFVLVVLGFIVGIPIQHRALNKIAFGRSMFITISAILMGLFIGLYPSIAATIVSLVLILIGAGFMALMSLKSYQHLKRR